MILSKEQEKINISKTDFHFLIICVELGRRMFLLGTNKRKGVESLFNKLKKFN